MGEHGVLSMGEGTEYIGMGWKRSTMDGVSTEYLGWGKHGVPGMG